MLSRLNCRIFTQATIKQQNRISLNLIQQLQALFDNQFARKEICRRFCILPNYLTHQFVRQFSLSDRYKQYLNYANKSLPAQQAQSLSFEHTYLTQFTKQRSNTRYLEGFMNWLLNQCASFKRSQNDYIIQLLRFQQPDKWFQRPSEPRVFIYHHGPTNSGKSTAAIKELQNLGPQQKGIYMAPLRLLAWQYQQKLGKCTLITGQEKEYAHSNLISCTIEAVPLWQSYEVAVIDEIQMIADSSRGSAWTRTILGINAKRVHLCGDQRALGIVSKLLQLTGDRLEERKYSRLSKLKLIHQMYKLERIQPGDCLIGFSVNRLIKYRRYINKMLHHLSSREKQQTQQIKNGEEDQKNTEKTIKSKEEQKEQANKMIREQKNSSIVMQKNDDKDKTDIPNKTAIVYGKLPPDCRKMQAKAFNQGFLPYLVATNAIGMGLNLNIKKIVFVSIQTTSKQPLEEHQIQQIAGRAGRGQQTGYVQCTTPQILRKVKKALSKVNLTYGIQLQNLTERDESKQNKIAENQNKTDTQGQQDSQGQQLKNNMLDKQQAWNDFLGRNLTQKERHISKACLYYQIQFLLHFKHQIQNLLKQKYSSPQLISYLRQNVVLNKLYFMQQETEDMKYLLTVLESKNIDFEQMFVLYSALSLSFARSVSPKHIKRIIDQCHLQIIDSFTQKRKVPVPKLLVDMHNSNFNQYTFMGQLVDLQYFYHVLQSYVWLWNKFQFVFFEVQLAQRIKLALSAKINQVLNANKFSQNQQKRSSYQSKNNRNNHLQDRKQDQTFSRYQNFNNEKQSMQQSNKEIKQLGQQGHKNTVKRFAFIDKYLQRQKKISSQQDSANKNNDANKQVLTKDKKIRINFLHLKLNQQTLQASKNKSQSKSNKRKTQKKRNKQSKKSLDNQSLQQTIKIQKNNQKSIKYNEKSKKVSKKFENKTGRTQILKQDQLKKDITFKKQQAQSALKKQRKSRKHNKSIPKSTMEQKTDKRVPSNEKKKVFLQAPTKAAEK